jgi:uncharacterized BrkB/YihY/UPF0761 family membrane protein
MFKQGRNRAKFTTKGVLILTAIVNTLATLFSLFESVVFVTMGPELGDGDVLSGEDQESFMMASGLRASIMITVVWFVIMLLYWLTIYKEKQRQRGEEVVGADSAISGDALAPRR